MKYNQEQAVLMYRNVMESINAGDATEDQLEELYHIIKSKYTGTKRDKLNKKFTKDFNKLLNDYNKLHSNCKSAEGHKIQTFEINTTVSVELSTFIEKEELVPTVSCSWWGYGATSQIQNFYKENNTDLPEDLKEYLLEHKRNVDAFNKKLDGFCSKYKCNPVRIKSHIMFYVRGRLKVDPFLYGIAPNTL